MGVAIGVGHKGYKNQTLPSVKCKDFFRKKYLTIENQQNRHRRRW
jgi:hypothetical protein